MICPPDEEQRIFLDTTLSFLQRTCGTEAVRALADTPAGFDRAWWRQGAELGWTGLLVAEELGGGSVSGAGLLDLLLVAEQLGRHVGPGPLIPTSAALAGIAGSDGAARHARTIDAVVAGESVLTWCAAAARGETGPTLSGGGDGLVLSGTAVDVEAAADADVLLVSATSPDGPTQVLVAADAPGVTVTTTGSIDLTRRLGVVRFDGTPIAADALVGVPGGAADDIARQRRIAVVLQCAEAVGAAERVFDFTLDYVADRFSFGRPLSSYQALKHRFADMKTWLEAARGIVAGAARAEQAGGPEAERTVAAAKAYAGDVLPQLVQDCVQMHGGIGVTWEHDLHLYLRRVSFHRALYGTPNEYRRRLASSAAA
ncbi:MAG: acyl-CoA/acyl-ACP dehydrogenase [Pseudonocardia sp.]|nr:acyl-CoA/acyl-ACP dehydrogenase [Pseudonocardia sp.]